MAGLRSGAFRIGTSGKQTETTHRETLWPPGPSRNPDPETPQAPAGRRLLAAADHLTPATLWRHHRLFTVVVLVSLIPRIIASLGFKPALFIQDSFSYLVQGVHLGPNQLRPVGYPMLLRVLEPLHSLLLVTTVQHLMGIAMGVIIYALLRSRNVPAWGATLAAAPTLFDSRQIWSEMSILPDLLFTFVVLVAVVLLLTRRVPRVWQATVAGLLISWASVIRGNGAFVFVAVFLFLLIRRVGWRAVTACVTAFAIPLLAYMTLFYQDFGQFNITNSTGIFVWSRMTSFANCAVIKPPPDLVPLCPDQQPHHPTKPAPPWSVPALLNERTPPEYLWDKHAWFRHDAHPGFNGYNNKLAEKFDVMTVEAQPLAYLGTVGKDLMLTFLHTDRSQTFLAMHFTVKPHVVSTKGYMQRNENEYAHTTSNTHPVQPWAYFMFLYQLPVYFPGIALFAVMLVGLVRLIRRWRYVWSSAALPWAVALINLVVPIALVGIDYRYIISAVPFACLAVGMVFLRPAPGGSRPLTAAAGAVPGAPEAAIPAGHAGPAGQVLEAPAAPEPVNGSTARVSPETTQEPPGSAMDGPGDGAGPPRTG